MKGNGTTLDHQSKQSTPGTEPTTAKNGRKFFEELEQKNDASHPGNPDASASHHEAAGHHEAAARHHRLAADEHSKGEHRKAEQSALRGQAHSEQAHAHSTTALRNSTGDHLSGKSAN
ncbi:MAG TPA: hypothetical protein VMV73_04480 [Candidatus Dormibacteraeota bacterium]|nr:hypothetical protein [Candidatus Dormibacteraeota bacterium]